MDATTQATNVDAADLAVRELQSRCHDNHFFAKLAAYGFVPRDEQEAGILLQMGENAYAGHLSELNKQADARGMFLRDAAEYLARATGSASEPRHVKAAAAHYAGDANLLAAAMTLTSIYDQASN